MANAALRLPPGPHREPGEDAFRALFELSPVGLCFSALDGHVLRANRALCDLLGYQAAELQKLNWLDFVHAEDLERTFPATQEVLNGTRETVSYEKRLIGKDGRLRCTDVSIGLVRTPAGEPDYTLSVVRDLTDGKLAEARRREAQARLEEVVYSADIGLFSLDPEGVFTMSVGRGLSAIGKRPGESVGGSVFDLYGDVPEIVHYTRRALSGEPSEFSVTLRGKRLRARYTPQFDADGKVVAVHGHFVDTTELELAAEAHRESEAKSRFLAAMSHELRTPLNSILGFSQLLEEPAFGQLSERQLHYLTNIRESGEHLLALINDLLDISKFEAGEMTVALEEVELAPIVLEAISKFDATARQRRLRIENEAAGEASALADPRRLLQVVLNLLSNAVKFTPEEGVIRVRLVECEDAVELSVADTGIGIPEPELERIFDEFHQVEATRSRSAEGTGLGLPLSRRLVALMGGEVRVTSTVGEGSVFTVRLPRR